MKKFFGGKREGLGGLQRVILTERGFGVFLDMNAERSKEWGRAESIEVRRLQQVWGERELEREKMEKFRNERYGGNRSVDNLSWGGGGRVGGWKGGGFLKAVSKIMSREKRNGWGNDGSNSLPSGHARSIRKTGTIKEQPRSGLKQQKIANGRKSFRDVGDKSETDEVFIRIDSVKYPLVEFPEKSGPESIMQQFKNNSKSQNPKTSPHSA